MSDKDTIAIYDEQTKEYAEVVGSGDALPDLKAFLNVMPKGGQILDLGCGPGHAGGTMAQLGFDVVATDASAEMVRHAREVHGLDARQQSFDELSGIECFDGVWASFSLLHAAKTDFPRHIAMIHQMLRPEGTLYLGMKLGQGEIRDRLGRFYAYYTRQELTDILTSADYAVQELSTGSDVGLDGTPFEWLSLLAVKQGKGN